jgi:hypothetical protein
VEFVTYRIAFKVFMRGMCSKQLFFVLPYRQRALQEVPLGCRLFDSKDFRDVFVIFIPARIRLTVSVLADSVGLHGLPRSR